MSRSHIKLALGLIGIAVCIVTLRMTGVSELFSLESLRATILEYGIFAPVAYLVLYVVASVLFIPGTPLTLAGGVIFGPLYGTVYTVIGATLGAGLSFALMRYFSGGFIETRVHGIGAKLAAYDSRLAKHGFLTVLLLRLMPIFPFNGLNFALGLTSVRSRDYMLGTAIGIMPGTAVLVYFGDSLASLDLVKLLLGAGGLVGLTLLGRYIMKRYNTTQYE